jgi:shikimate dehydrogenase
MAKAETTRPILNEAKAAHVKTLLEQYKDNPEKQKEILVDEIVDDSISMFLQRKPLYDSISDHIIKTDRNSPEEIAQMIFDIHNEALIKERLEQEEKQRQEQKHNLNNTQNKEYKENTEFQPATQKPKNPNTVHSPTTDPFSRPEHKSYQSSISAKTKMCVIIGDPVEHSLSPKMHNIAYHELGIDNEFVFTAAKVRIEDVEDVVRAVRVMGIRGLTCTVPHKVEVMKYLDWIDPVAQKIGAVNTVVNVNGALKGYNTDWLGTVIPLEKVTDLYGKRVALIGAGGAARAMAFGVIEKGAFLKIYNRNQDKAKELAQELGCFSGSMEQLPEVQDADIIINSTPIGMGELEDQTPIPSNLIQKGQICFDAVYVPFETKFLTEAKNAGAEIIHGIDMLLHQGTAQFSYYTNREAPESVMRQALLEHFGLSESGK